MSKIAEQLEKMLLEVSYRVELQNQISNYTLAIEKHILNMKPKKRTCTCGGMVEGHCGCTALSYNKALKEWEDNLRRGKK